jgi:hypothetical protein
VLGQETGNDCVLRIALGRRHRIGSAPSVCGLERHLREADSGDVLKAEAAVPTRTGKGGCFLVGHRASGSGDQTWNLSFDAGDISTAPHRTHRTPGRPANSDASAQRSNSWPDMRTSSTIAHTIALSHIGQPQKPSSDESQSL